jgi:tRNA-dihydrouridine synthase B
MVFMNAPELILAPIQGATNATLRTVFNRHFPGFDWAVAPFITTTHGFTTAKRHFRDILPAVNKSLPVVPQLLGNDPHDFARMAHQV